MLVKNGKVQNGNVGFYDIYGTECQLSITDWCTEIDINMLDAVQAALGPVSVVSVPEQVVEPVQDDPKKEPAQANQTPEPVSETKKGKKGN